MTQLILFITSTLLLSAFFSAAEAAFAASSQLLFELENRKQNLFSKIINHFYSKPDRLAAFILTGNCITRVVFVYLLMCLTPSLDAYTHNRAVSLALLAVIAVLLIFLVCELLIKLIARINPNRTLHILSIPLYILYIVLFPIAWLLSSFSRILLRLFGVKTGKADLKSYGREDLDLFIQQSIEDSGTDTELDQEIKFFQNAMEFSTLKIRDCMIPRTEIVAVERDITSDALIDLFVKTGYSKLVVYEEDIDHITGYIHSSELFVHRENWTKSILTLPFVPENMQANKLMKNMLAEKKSMAVVVDEFGGTAGIITLEDLVEEIFGEIEDEHDNRNIVSKKVDDTEYVLSGRMEIDLINEEYGLDIPESDEYMTIAGYILNHLQNFPKANEVINIDKYTFKIIKVTNTKIELVRLKVN